MSVFQRFEVKPINEMEVDATCSCLSYTPTNVHRLILTETSASNHALLWQSDRFQIRFDVRTDISADRLKFGRRLQIYFKPRKNKMSPAMRLVKVAAQNMTGFRKIRDILWDMENNNMVAT